MAAPEPVRVRLLSLAELPDGQVVEVVADDRTLAVARVGSEVFAVHGTCPHAGGPLGDGQLDGCTLTCPWHGWSYDLRTGISAVDPSVRVETFGVRVIDGVAYLESSERPPG
ncbi:MAG: Rieske 2Fe-2S domain-containing protein [Myxococcota bacterium]